MNTLTIAILWVLSVILFGSLVKGVQTLVWDKLQKPFLAWLLKVLQGTFKNLFNRFYLRASILQNDAMSRWIAGRVMVLSFLAIGIFAGHLYGYDIGESYVLAEIRKETYFPHDERDAEIEAEIEAGRIKARLIAWYVVCGVIAAYWAKMWISYMSLLFVRSQVRRFNYRLTLATPHLKDAEILKFRARFASMLGSEDFNRIIDDLNAVIVASGPLVEGGPSGEEVLSTYLKRLGWNAPTPPSKPSLPTPSE